MFSGLRKWRCTFTVQCQSARSVGWSPEQSSQMDYQICRREGVQIGEYVRPRVNTTHSAWGQEIFHVRCMRTSASFCQLFGNLSASGYSISSSPVCAGSNYAVRGSTHPRLSPGAAAYERQPHPSSSEALTLMQCTTWHPSSNGCAAAVYPCSRRP